MSSSAASQRLVLMGAILGAHGIKGEVKVKSFAAKPADIAEYGPLTDTKHKRSFDLAIVDLGLPDGNGTEIVAALSSARPRTTIVIATVMGDDASVIAEPEPDEISAADLARAGENEQHDGAGGVR